MIRRIATALLWLLATWVGGGSVMYFVGVPAVFAPIAGVAVALLVLWDPGNRLWAPRPDRKLIRRRIADLERVSPSVPDAAAQPQPEPASD